MSKKYVVLGGTGTLGSTIIQRLLKNEPSAEILCLSRCELKQKETQKALKSPSHVRFRLCDIRNRDDLDRHFVGAFAVFHCAALKHVEVLEENPEESVKTNILGTINVAEAARKNGVPFVAFSSTDKAVDPINVYGMCKGISERILLSRNGEGPSRFSVFRWGNVVGSRGSAVLSFAKSLKEKAAVDITDAQMTRFWIKIEDAVDFMLAHYQTAPLNEVLLPDGMKAATLLDMVSAIADKTGVSPYSLSYVGLRAGEKLHESLMSEHGPFPMSSYTWERYTHPELVQLLEGVL